MALAARVTPTSRHASATSVQNAMPSTATKPNEPNAIGKLLSLDMRSAKNHLPGQRTARLRSCGIDLVFINEREEISGIDRGARPCRHRPASLNPANEAARGGWIAAGTTRTSMGS
eukprot:CAMPEP_0181208946 /NCGR_PEP_ID=MMETSP1096-20121128/22394_1 /TAXON_ID=156174 ORGANISM="Chrysochromulina ericina, Strain CCMP281" /NCGR_SAMPLE_ID=MMETSP1096 /ASSEMBLY_ACC=CAM_ASM_000453 /LENGTH=115 /DNA_ID=CAMNT_0023300055 /DNA_START=13 /DNA_END=359 /DNA_ORIENTATION=+